MYAPRCRLTAYYTSTQFIGEMPANDPREIPPHAVTARLVAGFDTADGEDAHVTIAELAGWDDPLPDLLILDADAETVRRAWRVLSDPLGRY